MRSIQTNPMIFMSDRLSVAFSFSRRAHLLTTCKAGGGIPPVGRARALFTKRLSAAFPEGTGNVASEHSLCSRLYILHYQQNDEVAYCPPPSRRLPAKTLPRTNPSDMFRSFYAVMGIAFPATPIFSFQKRNRKKGR